MNIFARIKPLFKYEKVAYYSVCIEDNDQSLYEDFVEKQTKKNKDKLYHIQKWLKILGEKYGAKSQFFRNEANIADTSALPPIGKNRKPFYLEHGKKKANNLRLYCLKANENVVFLFSGELKTTEKAQDCPNVKAHFNLANRITKAIDKSFIEKDIKWNEDFTLLEYDEDFEFHY